MELPRESQSDWDPGTDTLPEKVTTETAERIQDPLDKICWRGPVLGTGSAGVVTLIQHKRTEVFAVVKSVTWTRQAQHETNLLIAAQGNRRIVDHFHNLDTTRFILEYCRGGDLEQLRLRFEQKKTKVPEALIWHIFAQLLEGLIWLHVDKGMVHRDIKPSNILLVPGDNPNGFPDIKIADFGSANYHGTRTKEYDPSTTPAWQPLDTPSGGMEADVFSVGGIVQFLALGAAPADQTSFPLSSPADSEAQEIWDGEYYHWVAEYPRPIRAIHKPDEVDAWNPSYKGPPAYSSNLFLYMRKAMMADKTQRATATDLYRGVARIAAMKARLVGRLPDWVIPPPPARLAPG